MIQLVGLAKTTKNIKKETIKQPNKKSILDSPEGLQNSFIHKTGTAGTVHQSVDPSLTRSESSHFGNFFSK